MSQNRVATIVVCVAVVLADASMSAAQEPPRWLLGASGALQTPTRDFQDNVTFELNVERGDLNADYRVGTGWVVDAGGAVRVWRNLVAGADVSYFDKDRRVIVDARVPHPLLFNRPRTVGGEADALRRTELGIHMLGGWLIPISQRLDVLLTAGPSYIRVRQPLVREVLFTETFPFNSAAFTGVTTTTLEDGAFGANVGADLTYRFHRNFGVGTRVRLTRASVETVSPDGDEVEINAGGLQLVAGLRMRFR
jgi:hypothetical protein